MLSLSYICLFSLEQERSRSLIEQMIACQFPGFIEHLEESNTLYSYSICNKWASIQCLIHICQYIQSLYACLYMYLLMHFKSYLYIAVFNILQITSSCLMILLLLLRTSPCRHHVLYCHNSICCTTCTYDTLVCVRVHSGARHYGNVDNL